MLKATLPHVIGLNIAMNSVESRKCEKCILGKQTRFLRSLMESRMNNVIGPVERVQSDVVGLIKSPSLGRSRYFVGRPDEFSGY